MRAGLVLSALCACIPPEDWMEALLIAPAALAVLMVLGWVPMPEPRNTTRERADARPLG